MQHFGGIAIKLLFTGILMWLVLSVLQFIGCVPQGTAYSEQHKNTQRKSTKQRLQEQQTPVLRLKTTATKPVATVNKPKEKQLDPIEIMPWPFPWTPKFKAMPLPINCPEKIRPYMPWLSPPGSPNNPKGIIKP